MVAFNFRTFISNLGRREVVKPFNFGDARGTSGTEIYSGNFDEEYLSKLLKEKGIETYDEMRRSDGQVRMLLNVVKNPIKSANWSIESVDESDEEKEIAEFISYVLFRDISTKKGKRKTFSEFLSEALTLVEFGHSIFEIVHKVVKGHKKYGDYIGLADLGFRHQRSILEWELDQDGSIIAVHQLVNGDQSVNAILPGKHLLVFTTEKEGDNYEGISMLRPCYGSWYRKNIYRKLQAIGIERAAKGVPLGIMPEAALAREDFETQRGRFQTVLDQLCAHEKNGVVLGAGYDIKELKIEHDSDKVQGVINSENVEMSKSFMANFMELGLEQNGGSYSLGSDLSDIFLSSIECVADSICERINLSLIEPLVNAKYGPREKYPTLTHKGINDKAGTELATALKDLIGAKAIQISPRLQEHVHKLYNLPDIDKDLADKEMENLLNPPEPTLPADPNAQPDKKKLHEGCCGSIKLNDAQRSSYPVSAFIEDRANVLAKIMRQWLNDRSEMMLYDMENVIINGRAAGRDVRKSVLKIRMPESDDYMNRLTQWAGQTAEQALAEVLDELRKSKETVKFADDLQKLPKKTREKIVQTLLLTAGYQDDDIEKAAYFSFNENYGTVEDAVVIEQMYDAVERYFEKNVIETAALNTASKVTNSIRNDVYHAPDVMSDIESFIFLNPDPETAICRSLVGRVFSKEEYASSPYLPPLHHNCKSYIAAQTLGASGNKPLTPGGLAVNDEKALKSITLGAKGHEI